VGKAARLNAERRVTLAAADQPSERLISELEIRVPFKTLFPVKPKDLDAITEDIQANGYDLSEPIHVWGDTVVDGHTRLQAALEAGLDRVPVYPHDFPDEDAALAYAIGKQRRRRNLTDAEILRAVDLLDQRKRQGERTDLASSDAKSGKSAAATAEMLGVSQTKVERARSVLDHADAATQDAVARGETTIQAAYREVHPPTPRPEAEARTTWAALLDDLEDDDAEGAEDEMGPAASPSEAHSQRIALQERYSRVSRYVTKELLSYGPATMAHALTARQAKDARSLTKRWGKWMVKFEAALPEPQSAPPPDAPPATAEADDLNARGTALLGGMLAGKLTLGPSAPRKRR
jgi:ParB-like chromosome segregation protein Spo0J